MSDDIFKSACIDLKGNINIIEELGTRVCVIKKYKMGITEDGDIIPVK